MDWIWLCFGLTLVSIWSQIGLGLDPNYVTISMLKGFGELLDLFCIQIGSNLVLAPIWIWIGGGSPLL